MQSLIYSHKITLQEKGKQLNLILESQNKEKTHFKSSEVKVILTDSIH